MKDSFYGGSGYDRSVTLGSTTQEKSSSNPDTVGSLEKTKIMKKSKWKTYSCYQIIV